VAQAEGAEHRRVQAVLVARTVAELCSNRRGLATMCVGVGQGTAMLIERV
jgi:acetyl-CoA acetyltransferase